MTTIDRLLMQKVQDQMDETGQLIEKLLVQISDEPDYDRETYIEMKAIGEQLAQLENRIRPLKWKGEPLK